MVSGVTRFKKPSSSGVTSAIPAPPNIVREFLEDERRGSGSSSNRNNIRLLERQIQEQEIKTQAAQKAEVQLQAQQNAQKAKDAQIKQTVITSRSSTLSSGGTPIRNVQLGKDVAEFNRRSFEEAKNKGRNLTQKEKVKLAGEVKGVSTPKKVRVSIKKQTVPSVRDITDVTRQGTVQGIGTTDPFQLPKQKPTGFFTTTGDVVASTFAGVTGVTGSIFARGTPMLLEG